MLKLVITGTNIKPGTRKSRERCRNTSTVSHSWIILSHPNITILQEALQGEHYGSSRRPLQRRTKEACQQGLQGAPQQHFKVFFKEHFRDSIKEHFQENLKEYFM